jgi:16S rRNA (uracil1498-N3)-methyltransferase
MHIFYTPDIAVTNKLPQEEAMHCVRVLRLKEFDKILLTDGKGCFYKAVITDVNLRHCTVDVLEAVNDLPSRKNRIEVALAPTKNLDRTEWFVEKATEIGIDKISFLNCRYSERRDLKIQRLGKIAISAMKQSMKATLPEIRGMTDFDSFISGDFIGERYIAHCYQMEKKKLSQLYKPGRNVLMLIGPEGDFSEEEVEKACAVGFSPVSLGEGRLRTETAALIACHTIHVINEKNFI